MRLLIAFAIYEIILGTKAHIPVPKQETVGYFAFIMLN
jgi:hypothetical protein